MLTTDALTRPGGGVRDVTGHREGWRRLAGVLRVGAEEDTRAPVVDAGQSAGGGDGGGRGAPPPALPPQHTAHRLEGRARYPQE